MVMLELKPGERIDEQEPHPGEQFGYVLQGSATLRLDGKAQRVGKGHCFYFEADKRHQIGNDGKSTVRLLWVISPPQM